MGDSNVATIAEAANLILLASVPVLLLDACALLDVIRTPIRRNNDLVEAARLVTEAATATPGRIIVVITRTVVVEWAEHASQVRGEVERELRRVRDAVELFREACRFANLPIPAGLSSDYQAIPQHLHEIASRLYETAITVEDDRECQLRALARHRKNLPPSRRGAGQIKDCEIIEHVLDLCRTIRTSGFTEPCFFVSSNTNDYCEASNQLQPSLETEFQNVDLQFVQNISWTRGKLTL